MDQQKVGEVAVRFTHSGERYVLGFGPDFFGIWDRNVSGGPVARFPRTDEGWVEAWNQFTGWERRFVEVGGAEGVAPARAFRSTAALSKVVTVLVLVAGVVALLTVVYRLGLIGRLGEFERGGAGLAQVRRAGDPVDALARLTQVVIVVAGVFWLLWQHRAHSNLAALGATGLRFTPGWAVWWWFIPLANFVMPFLTTVELWKASAPDPVGDWRAARTPALLGLWWAFWLARVPLGAVAAAVAPSNGATPRQLSNRAIAGIGWDLSIVVAAVLAVAVVRGIQSRQERSRARSEVTAPAG